MITFKPVIAKPGEDGPPTRLELEGHLEFVKAQTVDSDFAPILMIATKISSETIHNAKAIGQLDALKSRMVDDFKNFLEGLNASTTKS